MNMKTNWRQILVGVGLLVGLAGCASLTNPLDDLAATKLDVQDQAWGEVKDLTASLERIDSAANPGIAALVGELQVLIAQVEAAPVPEYELIDAETLIRKNPNFWRAMLELNPTDPTLMVLEGMILGAAGHVENASDTLELARAGPLLEKEIDQKLVMQRRTISMTRFSSPGLDLLRAEGLPADQRWEPVKRIEQKYPDSATAAMAVLQMRCDLAEVELTPANKDQRMRDKILAAEPGAIETLKKFKPLWAALITANGDAGDAARRVAEMLTPDGTGVINFSEEDFEKLVADLNRVGASDWALRASRLQMAQRGGHNSSDIEVWRQLLPDLIGEEAAQAVIDDWENGRMSGAAIYTTVAEPTGTVDLPMNSLVGGHYERRRRDAALLLESGLPTEVEKTNALLFLSESAIHLGKFEEAERALNEYAPIAKEPRSVAQQQLQLAMARGDKAGAEIALKEIRRRDRRLVYSNFIAGNAEIMAGNWKAASDAFIRGYKDSLADPMRRGFSALHAFGAGKLAGVDRSDDLRDALELVEEEEWITKLILAALGEVDREQLLAAADEGRDYIITGQRCEAYFALAFAPGQTIAGRRADLTACRDSGMVGYIEYEFARQWLKH